MPFHTAYLTLTFGEWGGGCHELVQFEVTERFFLKYRVRKQKTITVYTKKTPFEDSPI